MEKSKNNNQDDPTFKKCQEYIRSHIFKNRTGTIERKINSYTLKHLFEKECSMYISNEMFINVMIFEGFKHKIVDGINACFDLNYSMLPNQMFEIVKRRRMR